MAMGLDCLHPFRRIHCRGGAVEALLRQLQDEALERAFAYQSSFALVVHMLCIVITYNNISYNIS